MEQYYKHLPVVLSLTPVDIPNVHAHLVFNYNNLKYDIENICSAEADALPDDFHAKHLLTDVAHDNNEHMLVRCLDLAHAECVELLRPYTHYDIVVEQNPKDWNNSLRIPNQYDIYLAVPSNFPHTTVNYLELLVHQYLVEKAVAFFFGIAFPDKASYWIEKSNVTIALVKDKIGMSLTANLKRPKQPF